MRIGTKLNLIVIASAVGLTILAAWAVAAMNLVKVNGPYYQRVAQGKDLVADVMPPPAYLIEADLNVFQLTEASDPATIQNLIEDGARLRREYLTRHEAWKKFLPPGELRTAMLQKSYAPGLEFLDLRDRELIPLVRNGEREAARKLRDTVLQDKFEAHRKAILEVVERATAQNAAVEAEVASVIGNRLFGLVALGLVIILACLALGFRVSRKIAATVKTVVGAAERMSAGDLAANIELTTNDEMRTLASHVTAAQETLRDLVDELSELTRAARDGVANHRGDAAQFKGAYADVITGVNATLDAFARPMDEASRVMAAVAGGNMVARMEGDYRGVHAQLRDSVNEAVDEMREAITHFRASADALGLRAEQLNGVSQQMGANAEETSAQAEVVSGASDRVRRNIETVAAATQEMEASIKEISKNATDAARVAGQAVKEAEGTTATVDRLGKSSTEIGNVIKVITSIAEQTNLLALNATIEAARAGEAGKGFAVVANEVKELAKETAKATEVIGQNVVAIQGETQQAVEAINHISSVIAQIDAFQQAIAGAVEEQAATTSEMLRNVTEVANGGTHIAENIKGVAIAATGTSSGASQVLTAAGELSGMATDLRGLVKRFQCGDDTDLGARVRGHASNGTSKAVRPS